MVIKMEKTKVERRGRVLIPKKVREKADIRGGESMEVKIEDDEIVLRPVKSIDEIKELRGCVKESEIDPLELKKMWEM